ncbi:MAG: hypothetical protein KKB37_13120 [Alphaproteobacteria bacterium]|nr:hypothetical protein [Alphaproteobacteria bacterium]
MLRFIGAVLRVMIGFALACLAGGFIQVLFAVTPAELMVAGDERLGEAGTWGLLSATQIAVFSAPFAVIAILLSEWRAVRSFAFHAIVGMVIAVAGFGLIHATESPAEASIVNSYAMAAYLTSGFVAGLVYWLIAGRLAGPWRGQQVRMESDRRQQSGDVRKGNGEPARRSSGSAPATNPATKPAPSPGVPKPSGSSSA